MLTASTPALSWLEQRVPPRAWIWGGILQLAGFAVLVVSTTWPGGSDFDNPFMAAVAWLKGLPPYQGHELPAFSVPDGPTNEILRAYYYSPMAGMLLAPFTFLSYPIATLLWRVLIMGVLVWGFWRFMDVVCGGAIPRHVRLFLLGTTALAGSVRWNLVQYQPTALIVGLSLLLLCAVIEERPLATLFFGVLISVKMTYLLPVYGLLFFRKKIGLLFGMSAIIGALNLASMLQTGVEATAERYTYNMKVFEAPGSMNVPDALDFLIPYLSEQPSSPLAPLAPKNRGPGQWAAEQLQLRFMLSGWSIDPQTAKIVSLCLAAAFALYIGLLWLRVRSTDLVYDRDFQAMLFCVLLAGSALIVYHQRYDALSLVPCTLFALAQLWRGRERSLSWAVFGVTLVFCYALTGFALRWWFRHVVVPHGLLVLVPVCAYMTLAAFIAMVAMLERFVRARGTSFADGRTAVARQR